MRQGKWKIVQNEQPFDEDKFELFDLDADPGETKDLSEEYPDKMEEMLGLWRSQRIELGIVLPLDL